MLKSFLTDAKHSQMAAQREISHLSQEKYDRLRKQAQLELSQDDDSDADDQHLMDFHRGKRPLQESEMAPEPRPFPMDFEQMQIQKDKDKQIEQIKQRFLQRNVPSEPEHGGFHRPAYEPTNFERPHQHQPNSKSNFSQNYQKLIQQQRERLAGFSRSRSRSNGPPQLNRKIA